MGPWVARFGLFSIDAAIAATTLGVVVALAMVVSRQPARRIFLARSALLGVLAVPVLAASAPLPRVELARHLGRFAPPADPRSPPRPDRVSRASRNAILGAAGAVFALSLLRAAARLILGGWASGVLRRDADPPSPGTLAIYEGLSIGRSRRPDLRVSRSSRLRQPVLAGLVRPVVLIPAPLDRPDAASAVRLALMHELAHHDRLDVPFGHLAAFVVDVWFYLPPIRWIRGQMRLDQEFLADHGAALGIGSSDAYARSLVDLAAPGAAPARRPDGGASAASGGAGVVSSLLRRVLMLVRRPFPLEPRPPVAWRVASGAVVAGLALLLSQWTARTPAMAWVGSPRSPSRFVMSNLVIDDTDSVEDRGPLVHRLPLRMTDRFDLIVEILATPQRLSNIRVVGRPIAPPCPGCPGVEAWHRVRIRRVGDRDIVELDDRPFGAHAPACVPMEFFTIDVPRRSRVVIRNLSVEW